MFVASNLSPVLRLTRPLLDKFRYNLGSGLVIIIVRKNLSGTELTFGVREHPLAYSFKCDFAPNFICDKLEVYYAAANKLTNSRYLLLIDLSEFEVLNSFLFTHIDNFDDSPTS